jgi:hypothetical protein
MSIVAASSVSGFFGEVVEEAIRVRGVDATDGATQYLVALLADYAHPDRLAGEALEKPLTLLLDEALRAGDAADRFGRLRSIGDGVLYGCGFFGEAFASRGVDAKYLHAIGTRAYGAAASMLRLPGEDETAVDVFGELAFKFVAFVDVIAEVANATVAMGVESSRGIVKAYERWLKTGSDRIAHALTSQGLVPMRGPKGVQ